MVTMVMAGLPEAPQRLSITVTDGYHVVFSWDAVTSAIVSDTSPHPTPVMVTHNVTVL